MLPITGPAWQTKTDRRLTAFDGLAAKALNVCAKRRLHILRWSAPLYGCPRQLKCIARRVLSSTGYRGDGDYRWNWRRCVVEEILASTSVINDYCPRARLSGWLLWRRRFPLCTDAVGWFGTVAATQTGDPAGYQAGYLRRQLNNKTIRGERCGGPVMLDVET